MRRILSFMFLTLCVINAQAAALPAYTGGINNSVGSIIQSKVGKQGFAANDPRFGATISAIGTAATTVAAGVATGAVATVGWPALLVGAGVSALVGGAIQLGANGLIDWLWPDSDHPNQTKISGEGMGNISNIHTLPAFTNGTDFFNTYGGSADVWMQDSTFTYALHYRSITITCPRDGYPFCANATGTTLTTSIYFSTDLSSIVSSCTSSSPCWSLSGNVQVGTSFVDAAGKTQLTRWLLLKYGCSSGCTQTTAPYVPKWDTPQNTVAAIPQSYVTQPLSDAQVATIVNALWAKASTAYNPQAIPWNNLDPVTSSDVAEWRAANPELAPTVNDFISPVAPSGVSIVPFAVPQPSTNPGTDPGTGTDPETGSGTGTSGNGTPSEIEWGEFNEPNLDTPTIQSILDPIFNLWPEWANFAFPQHQSSCPAPQFEVFDHTFTFDHMCQWIEMIRPAMQSAFAVMWAVLVIFIVMGA